MKRLSLLLLVLAPLTAVAQSNVFQVTINGKTGINIPANSLINTPATTDDKAEVEDPEYMGASCQQILTDGKSTGNGIYTINANGTEERVYCLMNDFGGGWQLVVSIPKHSRPTELRWQADYPTNVDAVGDVFNPNSPYMYKGNLGRFTSATEGVSCVGKDCKWVFGSNLSQDNLNTIRNLMGSTARDTIPQSDVPACTNNYTNFSQGINNIARCSDVSLTGHVTSVAGWQVDVHGTPACWAMRSYRYRGHLQGSGLCVNSSDPNGTRYATLWMR